MLYRTLLFIMLFFCYQQNIYSQKNDLVAKAKELIYSDPDEAIKINQHILKALENDENKAKISTMLAKSYLVKGDLNSAITNVFQGGKQVAQSDYETQIDLNLLKAKLFRLLYLDNQHEQYLKNAENLIFKINNKNIHDSLSSYVFLEKISMHLDRQRTEEALLLLNEVYEQFKKTINTQPIIRGKLFIAKEKALSNLAEYDSAFVYLNKALTLISSNEHNNLYEKAQAYNQLGYLHLQKKEFNKSEETLFIALKFAEILGNPFLLEQINRNLAINYLGANQKIKHKVYNDEFLVLNNKVELIEQESVNTAYNIISGEGELYLEKEKDKYSNYRGIILASGLLFTLIGLLILIKDQWKKKRLKEIIKYLEISKNNFIKTKPLNKVSKRKLSFPKETEDILLSKLKRFESSNKFLNRDMSLALLSGQFETNTKYLSETIHKHYNDNFNTFINKLRINYIIDKLKNDGNYLNYKISFLAEESGFSSHSSFATVFKSIIGMSPATFIDLLKKEHEEIKKEPNA